MLNFQDGTGDDPSILQDKDVDYKCKSKQSNNNKKNTLSTLKKAAEITLYHKQYMIIVNGLETWARMCINTYLQRVQFAYKLPIGIYRLACCHSIDNKPTVQQQKWAVWGWTRHRHPHFVIFRIRRWYREDDVSDTRLFCVHRHLPWKKNGMSNQHQLVFS